jgi:CRISPR-associated endonuclease/helicase Cas3
MGNYMRADVADLLVYQWHDVLEDDHENAFVMLAQARQRNNVVEVDYRGLNRPYISTWRIKPYLLTHNDMSDGLYVVCDGKLGDRDYVPLTLKIDRILEVRPTKETFTPPPPQLVVERLSGAWGVWQDEVKTQKVVLRFEPRHGQRLRESVWHPTQSIEIDDDGYVVLTLQVAEPKEMVPWIRGWGSGVVVLEPDSLRQRIIATLRRQMSQYGLSEQDAQATDIVAQALGLLWAKYTPATGDYHLLVYHLLDVGAVADQMWCHLLSESQRRWVMSLLGATEAQARAWMVFFASVHDIGKATADFQRKAPSMYEQLLKIGLEDDFDARTLHGQASAALLSRYFMRHEQGRELGLHKRLVKAVARGVGGHHGTWITNQQVNQGDYSSAGWQDVQNALLMQLVDFFQLEPLSGAQNVDACNLFATFLSGFVSVVDWLGSMETYFPFERHEMPLSVYWERANEQAVTALVETGWYARMTPEQGMKFDAMFGFAPNEFQQHVLGAVNTLEEAPRAVIIEYMTGGGKTEASLYMADKFMADLELAGLYVAMPTQATSNQMFSRVVQFLEQRFDNEGVQIQLLHGQAVHHPVFDSLISPKKREGNESGLTVEAWFQNRKRALLSPYAVGTVDQAMLSVLQARHHFVRLYALSHKVIIFDEIHAYDTYMADIIEKLMHWLYHLNSPMILLSATLPRQQRHAMLAKMGVSTMPEDIPYPRMTIVQADGTPKMVALPRPAERQIDLQLMDGDIGTLVNWLLPVYEAGGCIAIICNTVNEAIATAQALRQHQGFDAEDVMLFHARFPQVWRAQIEEHVLALFGKDGERPARKILVSTQIIEQSLDLDFDVMVTRTAPIDLIIQRVGRVHRHARVRPAHLQQPSLVIRQPDMHEDVPDFGADAFVYAEYVLLRSWLVLREADVLMVPSKLDAYVEAVYGDALLKDITLDGHDVVVSDGYSAQLLQAKENMHKDERGAVYKSRVNQIALVSDDNLIGKNSFDLNDDVDHPNFAISTRDIRPSVDIICLHEVDGQRSFEPDRLDVYDNARVPDRMTMGKLLQRRLSIQSYYAKQAIEQLPTEPHWQIHRALRFARLIVFENGLYVIPNSNYQLRLSQDDGLEIVEVKA